MSAERRNIKRKKCAYFVQVLDFNTHALVGYFADLSEQGFRADLPQPIIVGQNYNLRVDLDEGVSDRAFIEFIACSRWQKRDDMEPTQYNAGFQIVGITPHDNDIFQRVVSKYGS